MRLIQSVRRLVIGRPEIQATETDQFLRGNSLPEQQTDYCNNATGKTVNEQEFEQAMSSVRQLIQLMYTNLLEKIGVTDFSRQFRFLLASQVMMYLLGRLLLLSKKEISVDARLVNGIERQLRNQIPDKRLKVKAKTTRDSDYRLPATLLSTDVVYIVFRPSAGRDNYHFAIDVYYLGSEPIYTEHRVSPDQQDDKDLRNRIVNAVKRAKKSK